MRYRELDGIRGLACLIVLFDHLIVSSIPHELMRFPGAWRLTQWLVGGVDLFFVLSGFLIGGILLDHKRAANYFRVFWVRRIGRIMPVYYLLFASFCVVLLVRPWLDAPWLDQFLLDRPMPVWTYALFVQNFAQSLDGGDGGARWVASTWSLAIEEQFYLLLPLLVFALDRRKLLLVALACIPVAAMVRGYTWQATGLMFTGYFLLPGRMDGLMCGFLAALAVRHAPTLAFCKRCRVPLDIAALGVFAALNSSLIGGSTRSGSFVVMASDYTFRSVLFAYVILRVFLVPETSIYRRLLSARALVFFGVISYALYMYHPAINGLLFGIFYGRAPILASFGQAALTACVIAVSIGLAWLSTWYFEMPIRRMAGRVTYRGNRPEFALEPSGAHGGG